MKPRSLDHLVLPTADLAMARLRLGALGFTVAPEGVHPFGTKNACVYFADGTFLESLAVADPAVAGTAVAQGNSFVLGDRNFRQACGEEGFSAIVLGSGDADADDAEFAALGVAGGAMVEFSRPSVDMDGNADTATFRLAFAAYPAGPNLYFFTCERRRAPKIDRSSLERHPNGATRIVAIGATDTEPENFAGFLAKFANGNATALNGKVHEVALANAAVDVVSGSGARLTQIVFGVAELAATAALFDAAGVAYERQVDRLRVQATAGQGADFVFEEAR